MRVLMNIRDAVEADLPALLEIFNDVVATSTAIYMDAPTTLEERAQWRRGRIAGGFPVIVSEDESGVTGYASFGEFRGRPGYRFTVEHSVYVRDDRRGSGIGVVLMEHLLTRAKAQKLHVMIAGVDAENKASIRFHERLGFERVAHFKQVGYKFGRWLDLVFLQRTLD
jgi:L-amino acid N-acyltransferase YncA